jgi:hypothetical protein
LGVDPDQDQQPMADLADDLAIDANARLGDSLDQ